MSELTFVSGHEALRAHFIAMLPQLAQELKTDKLMDRATFAQLVRLAGAFGISDGEWKLNWPYKYALQKTIVRNWKDPEKPLYPDRYSGQADVIQFVYYALTGTPREEAARILFPAS